LPVHFIFLTPLPGLLAAELPDDAALAELAVEAGVGTGPAGVQALLAVGHLHFLADDAGVPVRVMAAFIHVFHGEIIAKVLMVDQASGKFKIQDTKPKPAQAGSLCHLEKNVGWELPTINLSTEQTTLMMVN
jgi:hypothetical protein